MTTSIDRTADHQGGALMEPEKVKLEERFGRFDVFWSPQIVGTVNDYDVKLVKARGEFVWHHHDDTDEFFLLRSGRLRIQLDGHRDVVLEPGEFFVIPRGVRHCPVAEVETQLILIEPRGTPNTGDAAPRGATKENVESA